MFGIHLYEVYAEIDAAVFEDGRIRIELRGAYVKEYKYGYGLFVELFKLSRVNAKRSLVARPTVRRKTYNEYEHDDVPYLSNEVGAPHGHFRIVLERSLSRCRPKSYWPSGDELAAHTIWRAPPLKVVTDMAEPLKELHDRLAFQRKLAQQLPSRWSYYLDGKLQCDDRGRPKTHPVQVEYEHLEAALKEVYAAIARFLVNDFVGRERDELAHRETPAAAREAAATHVTELFGASSEDAIARARTMAETLQPPELPMIR